MKELEEMKEAFDNLTKSALQLNEMYKKKSKIIEEKDKEIERLNNIINRTTKYVESLSSKGRGCDIYEDIKQEILKELKGSDKE